MTQLLEQDAEMAEMERILRSPGCNGHSMNFELSSGLQETLDTWCSSPRSRELDGGLIIKRDQAGGYELEPFVNPLANIDSALMFDVSGLDAGAGPQTQQGRSLEMNREHSAADAEVWLEGAIFEDPLPQDSHSRHLSKDQGMDVYNSVVWNQSTNPWTRQDQQASDTDICFDLNGSICEDLDPEDNHSINYGEECSMDMDDQIVVQQRGSDWVKQNNRSSDMDIYFDETVPEAYEYPLSSLKSDIHPNKALLSYTLQSPAAEDINDRSPPSSPTKPRYASSDEGVDDDRGRFDHFHEAMSEAYTPSPLMPSIGTHMASLSHILQSPPAEDINDRTPPPSQKKPKDTSPDEGVDDGGLSLGPFHMPPNDNNHDANGMTESSILARLPLKGASSTPQTTRRKRGRPPGTINKKKTLSAAQAKKIAASSLKRIETLRKRTRAQVELPLTADSQEGNASKRRRKNRAELRLDHESEKQLRRGGEFERRLNVEGHTEADYVRKSIEHGGEDRENQKIWERPAYDPDL